MPYLNRREFISKTAMAAAGGYTFWLLGDPGIAWAQDAEYTVGPVANGGTASGVVKYNGAVPETIMREVTTDFEVAGRDPRQWEGLNLGAGKGVSNAIIVLNGIATGKDFADETPTVYAEGSDIKPRHGVLAWRGKKTPLMLVNKDPILHSWIGTLEGGKPGKNVPTPAGFPPMKYKLKKPGLYELTCAPHPWERAWQMAVPHPYYAMADADGKFSIGDVPGGTYKATVWAEGFMATEMDVTVGSALAGELTEANLTAALKG